MTQATIYRAINLHCLVHSFVLLDAMMQAEGLQM